MESLEAREAAALEGRVVGKRRALVGKLIRNERFVKALADKLLAARSHLLALKRESGEALSEDEVRAVLLLLLLLLLETVQAYKHTRQAYTSKEHTNKQTNIHTYIHTYKRALKMKRS